MRCGSATSIDLVAHAGGMKAECHHGLRAERGVDHEFLPVADECALPHVAAKSSACRRFGDPPGLRADDADHRSALRAALCLDDSQFALTGSQAEPARSIGVAIASTKLVLPKNSAT